MDEAIILLKECKDALYEARTCGYVETRDLLDLEFNIEHYLNNINNPNKYIKDNFFENFVEPN